MSCLAGLISSPGFSPCSRPVTLSLPFKISSYSEKMLKNFIVLLYATFSWDFIYAEYVMAAGYHHRSIVWQVEFSKQVLYTLLLASRR